jgi:hypothetical protein
VARCDTLKVAERGCRGSDGLGGGARKRAVPVADAVGNEGLVGEWFAVSAGAVAAAFPKTVDELGQ